MNEILRLLELAAFGPPSVAAYGKVASLSQSSCPIVVGNQLEEGLDVLESATCCGSDRPTDCVGAWFYLTFRSSSAGQAIKAPEHLDDGFS